MKKLGSSAALALLPLVALFPGPSANRATGAPSSHREAPYVTEVPKVDGTDFYCFTSYEEGREDFVTLVANYLPLQDPYGGPNYFSLDPDALYEIHVDNDGDAEEDLTFQFRFQVEVQAIALEIGPPGDTRTVPVPLANVGPFSELDSSALNVRESYTLDVVFGDRRTGTVMPITNAVTAAASFDKPADYIGTKSIPDYAAYAASFVYEIALPDGSEGRLFVGQRKDPFVVNLGETFDLVNTDPLGAEDGETDDLADKNVTSLILELPKSFLVAGDPVIAAWTSASLRQARVLNPTPSSDGGANGAAIEGGAWTQVSRLGSPLVNEVVIGLPDKDQFNGSEPMDDGQFADYVTHPTLPALLEALFGVTAPTAFPRADLVQAFLTGVPGLNQTSAVAEYLRLNTETAPVAAGAQNRLGVIGGDLAGFPNGRRPGDDVVDIALRVVMGVLLPIEDAPSGQLPYTDGAIVDDGFFDDTFPYLRTPIPGSPNSTPTPP
jgi:hypothetical protein